MASVDDVIRARRSVRGFLRDRPVPEAVLREAFAVAQHAPSNCNVQPWRVYLASGAACERLRAALTAAVDAGERPSPQDPIDTFPGDYHRLQIACAVTLYGAMGIERGDAPGRRRAMRRNFELFDAPHAAVVCMDRSFGVGVALDVGMYVQSLMLALTARGIGTCPQASLRNFPGPIRAVLGIPDELRILCGIAIGYEDPAVAANQAHPGREPIESNVVIVRD